MTDFAVTGASGFVGTSLCRRLSKSGRSVRACVRNAKTVQIDSANIEIGEVPDISRPEDWEREFQGVKCVVHLAARVHQPDVKNIDAYRDVNVDGTRAIADGAVRAGVERLIFVSTIKVNGESTTLDRPFRVDDPPQPTDPYAISKWEAEQSLWDIARRSSLDVVVIRPVLIYGPGVRGNFLRMLRLIDRGVPLPLGAVKNKRSVLYVENLCDLIQFCGEGNGTSGRVLFASDEAAISTPSLFRMIATSLHRRAMLLSVPPGILRALARLVGRTPDVDRLCGSLCVDMTCTEEIGWSPPVSTQEAIESTTEWFRSAYK